MRIDRFITVVTLRDNVPEMLNVVVGKSLVVACRIITYNSVVLSC